MGERNNHTALSEFDAQLLVRLGVPDADAEVTAEGSILTASRARGGTFRVCKTASCWRGQTSTSCTRHPSQLSWMEVPGWDRL